MFSKVKKAKLCANSIQVVEVGCYLSVKNDGFIRENDK